jgi:DNA-binding transcriptional ArsR family regulator
MLYEELSQKFPSRVIEPFKEPVIIVDSKFFRAEWEEQLKAEGCKILVSDFMGRSCFLIRKPQPSNNSMGSNPSLEQTQIEEKPKPNVEEAIIQLIREGKTFKEIKATLGLTHAQLMGHLSALTKRGILENIGWVPARRRKHLKKPHLPDTQNFGERGEEGEAKPNLNINVSVKELLEVSLMLLDSHPKVVRFLLQKCMEQL